MKLINLMIIQKKKNKEIEELEFLMDSINDELNEKKDEINKFKIEIEELNRNIKNRNTEIEKFKKQFLFL